jgi:hypothetical protein
MQDEGSRIVELLTEIRDLQREHLDAYKAQSARAISLQQDAVKRYARFTIVVRLVLLPLLAALIAYVIYLGQKIPSLP